MRMFPLARRLRTAPAERPRPRLGALVGAGALLLGLVALPGGSRATSGPAGPSSGPVAETFLDSPRAARTTPVRSATDVPRSRVRVTRKAEPVPPGSRTTITVRVEAPDPGHLWIYLDRTEEGRFGHQWANGPLPGLTASIDQDCDSFTDPERIGTGTGFRCATPAGSWTANLRVEVPVDTRPGAVAYFDAYHQMGSTLWNAGGMSGGFVVGRP